MFCMKTNCKKLKPETVNYKPGNALSKLQKYGCDRELQGNYKC